MCVCVCQVGVYCSLAQLLDRGFYHADPHPGNLLMTHDGRLAYLDFGMMGHLDKDLRRGLLSAMVHLVRRMRHLPSQHGKPPPPSAHIRISDHRGGSHKKCAMGNTFAPTRNFDPVGYAHRDLPKAAWRH